ncbi:hypothetical protein ACU4GD_31460 [Cupriavidus basilensis]
MRDALARLADEGLLVYQPNRGFLVRRFQPKDIKDCPSPCGPRFEGAWAAG